MRSRVAVALIAVLAVTTAGCDVSLWPMFHDDALHAGVSSDTAVGASTVAGLSLRWKTLVTSGQQVKSSPAAVYNGTLNKVLVYSASTSGTIDAVDLATGTVVWGTSGYGRNVSSPAVVGNSVY